MCYNIDVAIEGLSKEAVEALFDELIEKVAAAGGDIAGGVHEVTDEDLLVDSGEEEVAKPSSGNLNIQTTDSEVYHE